LALMVVLGGRTWGVGPVLGWGGPLARHFGWIERNQAYHSRKVAVALDDLLHKWLLQSG
jgi:hypothetical protein